VKIPYSDPYFLTKVAVLLAVTFALCAGLFPAAFRTWHESHTMNTLVVTPAMRAEVVAVLADKVERHYLFAAKGKAVADFLRTSERSGRYRFLTTPQQLVPVLTGDIRDMGGDLHMQVEFSAVPVEDVGDRDIGVVPNDNVSGPMWLIDRLGRTMADFGVKEASVSDDGIGYVRITRFYRPFLADEKYAAAMNKVSDSQALIVDMRDNGGGYASSVALLASYFFDRPTHLTDIEAPRRQEREQMWTRAQVEGRRYGATRPVIVLTSYRTFSAGEDFTYAMQTTRRATIIGEPTRGGAHPVERYRLAAHFIGHIPVKRSISPITHTNWEGNGVQPDRVVPADFALRVAQQMLRTKLQLGPNRSSGQHTWLPE
jgi:hypothetical protein